MRLKQIIMPIDMLTKLFTTGEIFKGKCVEGLPKDAKFCYSYSFSQGIYSISLVFQSEEFEELKDGQLIPQFYPIFEKLN